MAPLSMLVGAAINLLVAVGTSPTAQPPIKPLTHLLVYKRSGGFAPSTRSLVVSRSGIAHASSSGGGTGGGRALFRLGDDRLDSLSRRLREAHLGSIEAGGGEYCADCYVYSIASEGARVELDESEVPPRLRGLIGEAEAIISAHTAQSNDRAGSSR